jgi:hypothetical protein
VLKYFGPY